MFAKHPMSFVQRLNSPLFTLFCFYNPLLNKGLIVKTLLIFFLTLTRGFFERSEQRIDCKNFVDFPRHRMFVKHPMSFVQRLNSPLFTLFCFYNPLLNKGLIVKTLLIFPDIGCLRNIRCLLCRAKTTSLAV